VERSALSDGDDLAMRIQQATRDFLGCFLVWEVANPGDCFHPEETAEWVEHWKLAGHRTSGMRSSTEEHRDRDADPRDHAGERFRLIGSPETNRERDRPVDLVEEWLGIRALRRRVEPRVRPAALVKSANEPPTNQAASTREPREERHQAERTGKDGRPMVRERADIEEIQRAHAVWRIGGETKRDAAAVGVSNDPRACDPERVEHAVYSPCLRGERHVRRVDRQVVRVDDDDPLVLREETRFEPTEAGHATYQS